MKVACASLTITMTKMNLTRILLFIHLALQLPVYSLAVSTSRQSRLRGAAASTWRREIQAIIKYNGHNTEETFNTFCLTELGEIAQNGVLSHANYAAFLARYCRSNPAWACTHDTSYFWRLDPRLQRSFISERCPGDDFHQEECLEYFAEHPEQDFGYSGDLAKLCSAVEQLLVPTGLVWEIKDTDSVDMGVEGGTRSQELEQSPYVKPVDEYSEKVGRSKGNGKQNKDINDAFSSGDDDQEIKEKGTGKEKDKGEKRRGEDRKEDEKRKEQGEKDGGNENEGGNGVDGGGGGGGEDKEGDSSTNEDVVKDADGNTSGDESKGGNGVGGGGGDDGPNSDIAEEADDNTSGKESEGGNGVGGGGGGGKDQEGDGNPNSDIAEGADDNGSGNDTNEANPGDQDHSANVDNPEESLQDETPSNMTDDSSKEDSPGNNQIKEPQGSQNADNNISVTDGVNQSGAAPAGSPRLKAEDMLGSQGNDENDTTDEKEKEHVKSFVIAMVGSVSFVLLLGIAHRARKSLKTRRAGSSLKGYEDPEVDHNVSLSSGESYIFDGSGDSTLEAALSFLDRSEEQSPTARPKRGFSSFFARLVLPARGDGARNTISDSDSVLARCEDLSTESATDELVIFDNQMQHESLLSERRGRRNRRGVDCFSRMNEKKRLSDVGDTVKRILNQIEESPCESELSEEDISVSEFTESSSEEIDNEEIRERFKEFESKLTAEFVELNTQVLASAEQSLSPTVGCASNDTSSFNSIRDRFETRAGCEFVYRGGAGSSGPDSPTTSDAESSCSSTVDSVQPDSSDFGTSLISVSDLRASYEQ